MKFILQLVVLLGVIYATLAAQSYGLPSKEHPNHCEYDGKLYGAGEYYFNEDCVQLTCSADFHSVVDTCGVTDPPPDSHVVQDKSKNYPDCCPRYVQN